MSTIVVMPGGFHPFHAGHASLYQSALRAFPDADVYVAATNDTKTRPFPFAVKEKLAKLAGVKSGRFVQVKSPFKAEEITSQYDPNSDVLIFVRSEKDRNEQPKPGGTKKDGTPAYFQPYTGKNLQPFSKHAYMAYLPTVEFGPGITSASEIRAAWPTLNDKRKTAMVMSLYPTTQKNPKLAASVVKLMDVGMGEQTVTENDTDRFKKYVRPVVKTEPKIERTTNPAGRTTDHVEWKVTSPTGEIHRYKSKKQAQEHFDSFSKQDMAKGLTEMDKTQTPPGRDGSGINDSDAGKKQYTAKAITPSQATKAASDILNKSFKDSQRVDPRTGKKMVTKGVAEGITADMRDFFAKEKPSKQLISPKVYRGTTDYLNQQKQQSKEQSELAYLKVLLHTAMVARQQGKSLNSVMRQQDIAKLVMAKADGTLDKITVKEQGIEEARRNPERNMRAGSGKYDLINYAEDIRDKDNWAVSMTTEPKLGINPRPAVSEDTPKGIYFYPLRYFIQMADRNESLPWGDNMPYMQLFQYDRSGEMTQQTKVDPAKLKQALSQYCSDEIIQQAIDEPEYDGTPYWTIYDCLSRLGKGDETNVIRWNKVLRDLGFTSVYDSGKGWIAYNEPTQGVILDPRVIKAHKMFSNRNPTMQNRPYDMQHLADSIGWSSYFQHESQLQRVFLHPDKKKVMLDVAKSMLRPFLGKTPEEAKEMGINQAIKDAADKVIEILKQEKVSEDKETDPVTGSVMAFYRPVMRDIHTGKVDDYVEKARELLQKTNDPSIRKKLISIFKQGKNHPGIQGGIITAIAALLGGGIINVASDVHLTPYQTNLLMQAVLNTIVPTVGARMSGKNWKDTLKYTLASLGVGTGIAAAGLIEDELEETKGLPYPGTYEQENNLTKHNDISRRITAMTETNITKHMDYLEEK